MFVRRNRGPQAVLLLALVAISGCSFYRHERPRVTALPASPANQCEPPGIPFYLPKPLLVISKNFYHVEEPTVGLTDSAPIPDSFDAQDKYGSVSLQGSFSRTSSNTPPNKAGADTGTSPDAESPTLHSPGAPTAPRTSDLPSDGLGPHMFFTYEIVFVPDLSQKYVLQVNGGPGEMRAAMNLVNGWQFTGLGPYYLKDSSTAQNHMARGVAINLGLGGASDVINSIANLKSLAGDGKSVGPGELAALARALERAQTSTEIEAMPEFAWGTRTEFGQEGTPQTVRVPPRIENYAEIYVYEAVLEAGQMLWRPVELQKTTFDREFLGVLRNKSVTPGSAETGAPAGTGPGSSDAGSLQQSGAEQSSRAGASRNANGLHTRRQRTGRNHTGDRNRRVSRQCAIRNTTGSRRPTRVPAGHRRPSAREPVAGSQLSPRHRPGDTGDAPGGGATTFALDGFLPSVS